MNELKGKKILIFQQRTWGLHIGHFLAKNLQAEGCRLAALTFKRSTHEFVMNQTEVRYDLVINNDEIMDSPADFLRDDDITLAEVCRELGIDSVWPLAASLRNQVRSYGDKYYFGFKQNVSDDEIVDYIKVVYKFIKKFFIEFKPDIILAPNFVTLPHIMYNLYAKKRGVTMVGFADSKVSGIYVFTHSYIEDAGPFIERIDKLNSNQAETKNLEKAREYIKKSRNKLVQPGYIVKNSPKESWARRMRHELAPWRLIFLWYYKRPVNHLLSQGITPDYRPPRIILRDHFCQKRYKKYMLSRDYFPLEKIDKCVYFPLQFQPEATIDVIAPYFNNQIEAARLVAMSLPDDFVLAVKEHPGMVGLRPPSYIEKIARTPNVKLVDYRISSETMLKKCDLVVSMSGTTLAEAAFFRKPAIQLGNLAITLKLPNIFKHSDMTTLSKRIKEVLTFNLETDEYDRRLENYVAAAYDTGMDFDYMALWFYGGTDKDMEVLWQSYHYEIERILF